MPGDNNHSYNTRGKNKDSDVNNDSVISNIEATFLASFQEFKDEIKGEIIQLKNTIIANLVNQKKKLQSKVEFLEAKIETLEISSNNLQQYGRRNNLEISGIPDTIPSNELEDKAIEIFKAIDVDVEKSNIEACHRLGKKNTGTNSTKTIVRFVNRKYCKNALINRKKLRTIDTSTVGLNNCNLFMNENLTPMNNTISYKCRVLKRSGLIHSTFTKDGVVHICKGEGDNPIKLQHENKLKELFPRFTFDEDADDANEQFVDAISDVSLQSSY